MRGSVESLKRETERLSFPESFSWRRTEDALAYVSAIHNLIMKRGDGVGQIGFQPF